MKETENKVVQEEVYKSGSVQYIDSREVAEMVGKEHKKLLRDIRTYINQIKEISEGQNPKSKIGLSDSEAKRKIEFSDFFIESSYYVDGQSRTYPCYKVTLKGCEFIAHKLTGIKGTEFTVKYINRFHDMEDYIKQDESKGLIEQSAFMVKFVADDMKVNDASRILMYENLCKDFNIPTGFLPKYEHNGSRQMKALSALLKENGCAMSAVKFNQKLIEHGYLEEKERPSSKGGTKKFKALTEKGLKYGENAVNPHNQKEVQPLYYEDTFMQLYSEVA